MLKKKLNFENDVLVEVEAFLSTAPPEELILTLDGTGVNGSIQYLILSAIGLERLNRFKTVNILSASSYSYLCFLAMHSGDYRWDQSNAPKWDAFNRQCHKVKPFVTGLRVLGSFAGIARPIPNDGFRKALQGTVTDQFSERCAKELPLNAKIWLYNETKSSFEHASAAGPLSQLTYSEIITAAPAVPRIFEAPTLSEGRYSDPVYAPHVRKFYNELRSEPCAAHLFSNIRRHGRKDKIFYVQPHPYLKGDQMLMRDLGLFLLNCPNPAVYESMKVGLYAKRASI